MEGAGGDFQVAQTLRSISNENRLLDLHKEGIQQVEEALDIYKQLNETSEQARSWQQLPTSLYHDNLLDAAEEAISRAINLSDKDEQFPVCDYYRILGSIHHSKGKTEKAIEHFETAHGIASSFNWDDHMCCINYSLAACSSARMAGSTMRTLTLNAEPYAINDSRSLGRVIGQ